MLILVSISLAALRQGLNLARVACPLGHATSQGLTYSYGEEIMQLVQIITVTRELVPVSESSVPQGGM